MFWEDLKEMNPEEREMALEYMDEYFEGVALGNGDYQIGDNWEIVIEE